MADSPGNQDTVQAETEQVRVSVGSRDIELRSFSDEQIREGSADASIGDILGSSGAVERVLVVLARE
ncbi:hypothetical protein [Nocardia pseudobrasiliensis]|uniref:hypothetical protein n=1 Tax=Nocardia pseudobrasiliensis TaxID=45979 RepID=UPI0011C068A2|nr:hypothetical protein [Nocardia pseudobrasiliensis]